MRATSIRTDESATFGPARLTQAVITCPFDTMRLTRIVTFKGSLRAGSLVWVGDKEPRTGEKNEARKSEPARELLIFEFRPSRGVESAFHMFQITIQ